MVQLTAKGIMPPAGQNEDQRGQAAESLAEIDQTIHAPTRLKILAVLRVVERADFTYILNRTGLTRGNLSANLRKLEEAGYVHIEKTFVERIPRTLISLTAEGQQAIQEYRENMQLILDELLGA
jgi:DNA-binding MarR family transcriptional regulator